MRKYNTALQFIILYKFNFGEGKGRHENTAAGESVPAAAFYNKAADVGKVLFNGQTDKSGAAVKKSVAYFSICNTLLLCRLLYHIQ